MLKVGVVGYGFMGRMHSQCYSALDDASVVAVADADERRRSEASGGLGCGVFSSLEELLNTADVDIVDVCSFTGAHEEHILSSLARGKHVICEKPMSLTLESCDRIIAAASHSPGKVMIAHVIRFWPEYQVIHDIVRSGELGEVQWVSARRLTSVPSWSMNGWIVDSSASGGVSLDVHIHDQDFIASLIGAPGRVMARATSSPIGGGSIQTLGWGHSGGAESYAEASSGLPPGFPFAMSLLVACEKGTIKFDSAQTPSLVVHPVGGERRVPPIPLPALGEASSSIGNIAELAGYLNEISYFVDCVKTDRAVSIGSIDDARQAVRICLAASKSAETGQVCDL